MSKPTTLILRPRYLHKNHIKTNYKTQYPINQVLTAGIRKKKHKQNQVNSGLCFEHYSQIIGSR
jgi:hypothetical protein